MEKKILSFQLMRWAFELEESFIKTAAPKKYDHIDFKPPEGAAKAAERGLEMRKEMGGKGGLSPQQAGKKGIGSGVTRAVNLKNRTNMSPSTIKRMKAFFDRHSAYKKNHKKTKPYSKSWISWCLWGGDAGYAWARKVVKQMEAADKKAKKK